MAERSTNGLAVVSADGAVALASGLLTRWSDPDVFRSFQTDLESKLPGSPLRQSLIQAHLRVDELCGSLLDVVDHGRGSVAMMLSRAQLETAAFLCWVAVGGEAREWEGRLTRLLGQEIGDNRQRYPGLEPEPVYAELEQRSRALKGPPNARGAMAAVDKARERRGEAPFFESHYAHYALASSHLHSFQYGPAHFTGSPCGPLLWDSGHELMLNRAALRYGITYFVLGRQALFILIDSAAGSRLELDATPVREAAEAELLEVAAPTPDGWAPR